MIRQTILNIRQFLGMFQDIPPVPSKVFLPGIVAMISYLFFFATMGPDHQGAAFVTAFVLALACRAALRSENVLRRLTMRFAPAETFALVLPTALGPLALLIWADDPLWCQRMLTLYYVILGSMFLSDVMGHRNDMAALFWSWDEMKPFLPALTRMMVLFHMAFLLLNETMIRALLPSGWLVFWAVLPVISHLILSALILTVVNSGKDDAAQG